MIDIIKCFGWANITHRPGRPKDYIAIHYTAGVNSRKGAARACAGWFGQTKAQASADFICDDVETVQYNPDIDNYSCWAVGGGRYNTKGGRLFGVAFNCNTISIEICSTNDTGKMTQANDGHYHFTDAAVERAVELTKYLMQKYGIDADHVIRHYDVNGKPCPGINGWNADTGDESAWIAFKKKLAEEEIDMSKDELIKLIDERITAKLKGADTKPNDWAKEELAEAVALGITDGSRPLGYATRQETAMMVKRGVEKAKEGLK